MITEPTVFILGAGASKPYGYPTAAELREQIIRDFNTNLQAHLGEGIEKPQALCTWASGYREFLENFDKSATKSIDLFLARNPEFATIGKIAIVLAILNAEFSSCFREQVAKPEQDWYSYLAQRLTADLTKKEDYARFSENKLAIITFNYDRSLEHFLHQALTHSFSEIPPLEVKAQLDTLPIIHVFGRVASLDWEVPPGLEYRRDVSLVNIQKVCENLRIIYEEHKYPELERAREQIRKAQRIFFLGFGYAKENLDILQIPHGLRTDQRVYRSAVGLVTGEITRIQNRLALRKPAPVAPKEVYIEQDTDCRKLLRNYL